MPDLLFRRADNALMFVSNTMWAQINRRVNLGAKGDVRLSWGGVSVYGSVR